MKKHLLWICVLTTTLVSCQKERYFINEGRVFGTTYNIRYQATQNLEPEIQSCLARYDASLSFFNDSSIVSKINRNEDVETDSLFEKMYETAYEVSCMSQGGFDITCAPLIDIWGFGKDKDAEYLKSHQVSQETLDSLMQITGFLNVTLTDHHIYKRDPRLTINPSAIAKGLGCDGVAELLRQKGCKNYLVDIGGEVVAKGVNQKGEPWKIGISKPIDDPTGAIQEVQEIIATNDLCMASSGNYRQFYYAGQERRSHTIDPRTGYPVNHSLLGATVIAKSCMRADALATACMVLGADAALEMIEEDSNSECYLIISKNGETQVITSSGWVHWIQGSCVAQ